MNTTLTDRLAAALQEAREAAMYGPTGEVDLPGVGSAWMERAELVLREYTESLGPVAPDTMPESGSGLYLIQNPDGSNLLAHRETVDLLLLVAAQQPTPIGGGKSVYFEGVGEEAGKVWCVQPVDAMTRSVRHSQHRPDVEPMWGPSA